MRPVTLFRFITHANKVLLPCNSCHRVQARTVQEAYPKTVAILKTLHGSTFHPVDNVSFRTWSALLQIRDAAIKGTLEVNQPVGKYCGPDIPISFVLSPDAKAQLHLLSKKEKASFDTLRREFRLSNKHYRVFRKDVLTYIVFLNPKDDPEHTLFSRYALLTSKQGTIIVLAFITRQQMSTFGFNLGKRLAY